MHVPILRITTWISIFVRCFFCCISCLLQFVTDLQRQLHQRDRGGSRLMWRVGRVAMFQAGFSLSVTSNHSCGVPSAACMEHLHSRLLAAAYLPTHQIQYGNSQQTRWKCIKSKTRPQKVSPVNFILGICFRPCNLRGGPLKCATLPPEKRKSLNSSIPVRCSLYFCGDNHSLISGQEPTPLQTHKFCISEIFKAIGKSYKVVKYEAFPFSQSNQQKFDS